MSKSRETRSSETAAPSPGSVVDLLLGMAEQQASDLFLSVDKRPRLRVCGRIVELDLAPTTAEAIEAFARQVLTAAQYEAYSHDHDLDAGVSLTPTDRFRVNLGFQQNRPTLVARRVPSGELAFDTLRLPPIVQRLAELPRGLILVTGATGSGKSTTMAAVLHHINSHTARHIVTVEDPIEFVHRDLRSVVTQREVGTDTLSFAAALRHVVRQSPDAIFIGEMRDLDTISTAVSAALTGHLVVSTLHTSDVSQTLERIINHFPEHVRDQVALDLSMALAGIVAQRLVPLQDGSGRAPAVEVLWMTPLARRLIAERRLSDVEEVMKAGGAEGMQTFTRALVDLCRQGLVSVDVGAAAATNREEFLAAAQGMETGIDSVRRSDAEGSARQLSMRSLLKAAIKNGASDLLVSAGVAPMLRINGELFEVTGGPLNPRDSQRLLFGLLNPYQRAAFESAREIDFALSVEADGEPVAEGEPARAARRFRVNGFYQRGHVSCALRVIPDRIPPPAELGLPNVLVSLADKQSGLILVTGPTGHGKTTTLASLIDHINSHRACHVITIEDPIEYVHASRQALVEQREVHADTESFHTALKYILRQSPDVILIGEMRDPETIGAALTAAETGHLVLATLHTNDAVQTIDRIIDVFPAHQQNQVRAQLAAALLGVFAQRLVPRRDGGGRLAVFEVMIANTAIRSLIRERKTHQILAAMETWAKEGMITFDRSLRELYGKQVISREAVAAITTDPGLPAVNAGTTPLR